MTNPYDNGTTPQSDGNLGSPYSSNPMAEPQTYGVTPNYVAPGGYEQHSQPETKNGVAPWALGISIVGLLLTLTLLGILVSWVFVLVGLVLSVIALAKSKKASPMYSRKGMSIAALIISILSTLFIAGAIGFTLWAGNQVDMPALMECSTLPQDQQEECMNGVLEKELGQ
ncbi:hypothetical protein WG936_01170 [Corynebacterium sp. H127]|uniref:hypothetical protein n=1 Tax=Corynebacterium sp. H127 TaxID=3133418 RepID=UPI0030A697DF